MADGKYYGRKLWMADYGGQNMEVKLWKRNVMANYGGLFMEDNL